MCYDISFTVNVKQLSDYFPDLVWDEQISINFDASIHIPGHAYGAHPVIYKNRTDGLLHCKLMDWGCVPFYVKDLAAFAKQRASMLNARSERILSDTKSYWNKIRDRRCLIPVTGFYEHREVKGIPKKVVYHIGLKNQTTFFLPGLYSVAEVVDKDGVIEKIWTYTIITRAANTVMQQIHNSGDNPGRMPLMLPFEMSKQWVEKDLTPGTYQEILDFEMASGEIDYKTVYTIRSSKPRPDNKLKNEFYDWGQKVPDIML